jgi:hypothetical protein
MIRLHINESIESLADYIGRTLQYAAYSLSGVLVVSDWLTILDNHAGAFGVLLGFMTYITNLVFQCMNRKAILKSSTKSMEHN